MPWHVGRETWQVLDPCVENLVSIHAPAREGGRLSIDGKFYDNIKDGRRDGRLYDEYLRRDVEASGKQFDLPQVQFALTREHF